MNFAYPPSFAITVNFPCGVAFDEKTDLYISYCPELDLTSQGTTEIQAKEALRSAISLYLACAREMALVLSKPVQVILRKDNLWHAESKDICFSVDGETEEQVRDKFQKDFVYMIKSQTQHAYGDFMRIAELRPKFKFKKSTIHGDVT